jgi:hypothetical protein
VSSFKQKLHNRDIGRGEIMGRKIGRIHPADLLVVMKLIIPGEMGYAVSQQVDFPVRIDVMAAADEFAYGHIDAELFHHLPPEAILRGLALLEFPAGEFPFIGQVMSTLPAGNEYPAVLLQYGGSDNDSSALEGFGRHRFQTLATGRNSVKTKTLESGIKL